jgi:hypothetical protein
MEAIQPENGYEAYMSRFSETEAALLERLRTLKAAPEMSINLYDIGVPMAADGFSQEEIIAVLNALEQDKIITYVPGNRLLMLKELPE